MDISPSELIKVVVYKTFRPREYVCRLCGKRYLSASGARQHVKRKHLSKKSYLELLLQTHKT
jgi:hypothetical protein